MDKKIFSIIFIFAVVLFVLGYRAALERKEMTKGKNVGSEKIERQEVGEKIIDYRPNACLENESEKEIDRTWPIFQGNFFSIKYPIGFAVLEKEKSDYGTFQSSDKKVVFSVYSPQWTGEPEKLFIQADEILISEKEKDIQLDCENELGSDGIQKIRYLLVKAKDGSYKRLIVDIRLIASDRSNEARKTFSLQYNEEESRNRYEDDFKKFMDSLEQLAD